MDELMECFKMLYVLEREKVEITHIIEKMVESHHRWFGHMRWRLVEATIRRVDKMEISQISRGRGGQEKP
ncbi:hypothetical protein Lal_00014014 [Lupinus albus]|nr:hypothetical protein Lal_00014014 [Lupinus albus]